jgi:hypothetical protein
MLGGRRSRSFPRPVRRRGRPAGLQYLYMKLQVECYSGYKAEERPVIFRIDGHEYRVEEVLDQWYGRRTPGSRSVPTMVTFISSDAEPACRIASGTWFLSVRLQDSRSRSSYSYFQSSGVGSIPQTLPASFTDNPSNQIFSNSPSEMQWTTRASTLVLPGRSSRRTLVPLRTGRGERTAHPRRLARITTHGCEN